MQAARHLRLISRAAARTEALGAVLGQLLQGGEIVCLSGDLGAGKTAFARGIGAGWGADEALTSPTYNLAHEHRRRADSARLIHLDFYRISGVLESETVGLSDMLYDEATLVIEWAERVDDALPADRLWIDFSVIGGEGRELDFEAIGGRYARLLRQFALSVEDGDAAGV